MKKFSLKSDFEMKEEALTSGATAIGSIFVNELSSIFDSSTPGNDLTVFDHVAFDNILNLDNDEEPEVYMDESIESDSEEMEIVFGILNEIATLRKKFRIIVGKFKIPYLLSGFSNDDIDCFINDVIKKAYTDADFSGFEIESEEFKEEIASQDQDDDDDGIETIDDLVNYDDGNLESRNEYLQAKVIAKAFLTEIVYFLMKKKFDINELESFDMTNLFDLNSFDRFVINFSDDVNEFGNNYFDQTKNCELFIQINNLLPEMLEIKQQYFDLIYNYKAKCSLIGIENDEIEDMLRKSVVFSWIEIVNESNEE